MALHQRVDRCSTRPFIYGRRLNDRFRRYGVPLVARYSNVSPTNQAPACRGFFCGGRSHGGGLKRPTKQGSSQYGFSDKATRRGGLGGLGRSTLSDAHYPVLEFPMCSFTDEIEHSCRTPLFQRTIYRSREQENQSMGSALAGTAWLCQIRLFTISNPFASKASSMP